MPRISIGFNSTARPARCLRQAPHLRHLRLRLRPLTRQHQSLWLDGCFPHFTTAEGCNALFLLGGGLGNTGIGWYSNFLAGDASFNTGVGAGTLALTSRTGVGLDGNSNTALGTAAMILNLSGNQNTAVGTNALVNNMIASDNNAVGVFALYNNDSSGSGLANFNNAHGRGALFANVDGTENNALGNLALTSNVSGSQNTAVGDDALFNCTGNSNTALGDEAGSNLTGGEANIYIGAQVQAADPNEPEFIRIGNDTAFTFPYDTFIAGIFNRDVDGGTAVPVYVDANGKLGTNLVNAVGNKVATPQAMLNESRNQQKRIAELEGTVARLAAMVKENAAQIQKASAQLEMNEPTTKAVVNKP